ncbi:Dyp-type peroxidase [Actinoplanes sp. NPDC051851]|uniref:Dyp-type peroxidase n=1 Tax=Actinoplanes sp. NPDC051851 TaxID=3154753 RepID=UPI00341E740F
MSRLLQSWTADMNRLSGRTVTIGFGPAMFDRVRGLADRRPAALRPLPSFPGEAIDARGSHGDLCAQVCASTPAAAADGLRVLINSGREFAGLRWRQIGYRDQDGTADPRNPFGFRDGTANLDVTSTAARERHLWVSDGPEWMHGGTYLVTRRIRLLLDTWDRTALDAQESMIGRTRDTNRRTGSGHARLASGARMLRRSYTYDGGVDVNGLQDSGLIFISFQRDPAQFVAVQEKLADVDGLNAFSQHVASGVFACPPMDTLLRGGPTV